MSDNWDISPGRSDLPREFLVSAELYVSNAAGAALRKVWQVIYLSVQDTLTSLVIQPVTQRKRTDKRETSTVQPEDHRKLKGEYDAAECMTELTLNRKVQLACAF